MLAFLADMPIPMSVVTLAVESGHDARHIRDYGMQQATDPAILERAGQENRILLTTDLDFPRELALLGCDCPGLIVFRLGNVTARHYTLAFRQLLTTFRESEITGYITIVEPGRVRRRPLPLKD